VPVAEIPAITVAVDALSSIAQVTGVLQLPAVLAAVAGVPEGAVVVEIVAVVRVLVVLGLRTVLRRRGLVLVATGRDGDGDPDGVTELTAQHVGDQRQQTALEDALGELVGCGEHRGAGHQGQRLGALEPLRVLGLQVLALHQQFLQHPRPHCGKIGGHVGHSAHSLGSSDGAEELPRKCGPRNGREEYGVQPR
jgi:hypothetical protein